jgi:hypothetical protein
MGVTAFCSKPSHHARFAKAAFDRPCSRCAKLTRVFFRPAKFTGKGVAGNRNPIVHTTPAIDPTAQQSCPKQDCLSLGQKRQGGR